MEWEDKLSTGIPLLDRQHQALIDAVNELQRAAKTGRIMPTMYAMDQLRDYIREHFSAEEALMRRYDFPGLNAHIAEHRNFTARLQAMMLDNVHRDNTAELVQFLGDWLRHHLLKSDMEYVPYLTSATQLYERD